MRYTLKRSQQLYCDIDTAWNFFSSPKNLSKITPKEMNFKVISQVSDQPIFEGLQIDYTITPLLNLPVKWTTIITQVDEGKSFTDFQQKGPYKYWNHLHEFIPNSQGVLMHDTVTYELPLGFLGTIAHKMFVQKKLEHIFNYRFKILNSLFNK
ncbi:SRPBCC family protein [Myroides sp. JBRI-B21084]|nr:SRPBCC family protein [Paenimyroides cloacae]WKW46174.1 SRPBCC family protein [Paenimyroides cloacae]